MPELYETEEFTRNQIPIRIFNHYFEGKDIFTPAHWHQNVEFNLTTGGRIQHMVDGELLEHQPGDVVIVNSGVLHSNHWIAPTDYFEGVTVQVSKAFLDQWLSSRLSFQAPDKAEECEELIAVLLKFGQLKSQLCDVDTSYGEADKNETMTQLIQLQLMATLFQLLSVLKAYCSVEKTLDHQRDIRSSETLKEIVNYIDGHYQETVSLASVAAAFHYTPAYLSRIFKSRMGMKFHDYLQYKRLHSCISVMRNHPDRQLAALALDNGFPNVKSFIETFKKHFDCTPSEWLKKE
ncbi:helix-turn-helix domain-containing protein [Lactococcus piscium]|uniref:Putative transcriptional regulator, AraC family n=1 Tax=Pseudolactococcus piscium MKFS47 TaxID=297352 RepID=A0A0D6DVV0_9LACT|nr:helix-turn-helix domain-containing protein [Lactococcus piscium]CEN27898.1 Putative transcriptional regulator, AraC family [Lactococcus piscium MKFS47]